MWLLLPSKKPTGIADQLVANSGEAKRKKSWKLSDHIWLLRNEVFYPPGPSRAKDEDPELINSECVTRREAADCLTNAPSAVRHHHFSPSDSHSAAQLWCFSLFLEFSLADGLHATNRAGVIWSTNTDAICTCWFSSVPRIAFTVMY